VHVGYPPHVGKLEVSPSAGQAIFTLFKLNCSSAYDPEGFGPLLFRFGYINPNESNEIFWLTGLSDKTQKSIIVVSLPAGDPLEVHDCLAAFLSGVPKGL
jgi:hypothetical protein